MGDKKILGSLEIAEATLTTKDNNASEKHSVSLNIKGTYEQILIIGTENHPATDSTLRNIGISLIGAGPLSMPINSKMKFVMQALRKVRLNADQNWTILLCTTGYTDNQLKAIKNAFNVIQNKDGEKSVQHILYINSKIGIVDYINERKHRQLTDSIARKDRKIRRIGVYSHGVVQKFTFWLGLATDLDSFSLKEANSLNKEAFADNDVKIYSFACRTGLGNSDIDKSVFYEESEWFSSKKIQKRYDEKFDDSLAQALSNASGGTTHAFLKRSSYFDTFNTPDELDFLDACDAYEQNIKPSRGNNKETNGKYHHIVVEGYNVSELERYNKLKNIRSKRQKIDNATFDPNGALHPVGTAQTPKGLRDGMQTFKAKSK